MDKEGLLVIRIFFSFCVLIGLFNILKPELMVRFSAKWFQLYLKVFGFDSAINKQGLRVGCTQIGRLHTPLASRLSVAQGAIGSWDAGIRTTTPTELIK